MNAPSARPHVRPESRRRRSASAGDWAWVGKAVLAFAFALLAAAGPGAAQVRVDVDLGAQVMRVAADTGESYEWPISSGSVGRATPRGEFRPYRALSDGLFVEVRQRADAALDLLPRPIRDSRHAGDRSPRPTGLPRLHPPVAARRRDALRAGEPGRGGDPHRRRAGIVAAAPSPRLIALPMGRALELAPADSPPPADRAIASKS